MARYQTELLFDKRQILLFMNIPCSAPVTIVILPSLYTYLRQLLVPVTFQTRVKHFAVLARIYLINVPDRGTPLCVSPNPDKNHR